MTTLLTGLYLLPLSLGTSIHIFVQDFPAYLPRLIKICFLHTAFPTPFQPSSELFPFRTLIRASHFSDTLHLVVLSLSLSLSLLLHGVSVSCSSSAYSVNAGILRILV